MKLIHIVAGFLALGTGALALYAFKGGKLHRKSGASFVYAMLVMAGLGSVMAALKPDRLSAIGGVLACYMATTAMLTMRRRPGEQFHWLNHAAMLVALAVGIAGIKLGFDALDSPTGSLDKSPAAMYFIFGAIALLAGLLDMRMLLARDIQGKHRIARHVWRVGFAMFMAYGSFFLGQAKVFPEPLRKPALLAIPVLVVVVTVLYWLLRVLFIRRHAQPPFNRPATQPESPERTLMKRHVAAVLAAFLAATPALGQSTDADFDALSRARKSAELESLARERLARNPKDDVALWHLGREIARDARKRDELIARAEQCIKDMPQSARCHNLLGNLYGAVASSGSMASGIKYAGRIKDMYVRAVELDPRHFASRRDLNQFYLHAPGIVGGSVSKAIKGSTEYSKFDAARGQVLRADVHSYEEEFDEAESMLAAIQPGGDIELAEAVQAATAGLGFALIDDRKAARAQKLFERQIAADPEYANAHFGLGRALLEQKMLNASIASLDRALQLDPKVRAHYRLGIAYQGKGDTANALAMFRQFLSYSPQGRPSDDARKRIDEMTAKLK